MIQRKRRQRQASQQEPEGGRVPDTVALELAGDGPSLWLAIEAAQFARIILHEEPQSEPEERAMSDFVEAFAHYTEVWEETASQTKAAYLDTLGHHLAALKDRGLFVHWASVDRSLAGPEGRDRSITLSVVSIGRTSAATIRVLIPHDLEIGEDDLELDQEDVEPDD